jgi:uroporphyrinogen decarboxylase
VKPRERELAAIRHEIPDRIPVDAILVENVEPLAEHWHIPQDEVLGRLGLDGRIVSPWVYTGEVPGKDRGLNEWGTDAFHDYGTSHVFPLGAVGSVAEVDLYPWPDPTRYNYGEAAARARGLAAEYAVRGPYWVPLFCQVCSLMGMEETLATLMLQPRLFEAVLEHVTVHTEEFCRRFVAAAGDSLDILCLGDDFASQRGLLMRPELWRKYIKPRLARLFAIGKQAGKPVWFHSCGDITAVLPDLIDIGIDVWETVQLHTLPLSAQQLKREYGRHIAFFGGVNTQRLPFASPQEVAEETRRCIEALGEGGGYICGPDHHVKPDVSVANTVALFGAATAFRRSGYTQQEG